MFALQDGDEVSHFQLGRYISTSEAFWRIFDFPIHDRSPTVVRLSVHLENHQRVYFTENTAEQVAAAPPRPTTLTSFFETCQNDDFARGLLYIEMPSYYTWANNKWSRRKRGALVDGHAGIFKDTALGRIYTVHPSQHECFYLRLLLLEVRGPVGFDSLKTVDGTLHPTYRQAALELGLIEDDKQWKETLVEARLLRTPRCMRSLFAVMLHLCGISDPNGLWMQFREDMSEDFHRRQQSLQPDVNIPFSDHIFNLALLDIEDRILSNGGPQLQSFGLPQTTRPELTHQPREILRETSYDQSVLTEVIETNEPKLLPEQKQVFDTIMQSLHTDGGVFFLDAPGGTGKTFLINLILAKLRIRGDIAIAVASSGIAATLLPGGRTAHSAFKLPLNLSVDDLATCNISKGTGLARLLQSCILIVWDECTMSHKHAFEALDRSLQDIRGCPRIMGGVTVLLSGDFRQTLPVIPRGTRADMVRASLRSSYIWQSVKSLHLTTNMRARSYNHAMADEFAYSLIDVGNGGLDGYINMEVFRCGCVDSRDGLIAAVFGDLISNMRDSDWLRERAILAPKNESVDEINRKMLGMVPGETIVCKSIDTIPDPSDIVNYPTEFLNSLNPPGMPPHELCLKEGVCIMLLRNLEPPKLCNGTRLTIRKVTQRLIEAQVLTGCAKGEHVFIPRIPLIPTDSPIEFRRLQFPVKVSFAMTINKSQGQTLKVAGLQLEEPCFSHGQLYVALSRVGWPGNLFVLAPGDATPNIVYREALRLPEDPIYDDLLFPDD